MIRHGELQTCTRLVMGSEISLGPPGEWLLKQGKQATFSGITGSVMYLGQVTGLAILYSVNQLARATSKPSKAHIEATKHLLLYLVGTTDFAITYKQGGFKLTAFSDTNLGNNSDNGKLTSSYLVFLANAPISFKVGLQGLITQSTMEAELEVAALTMKEVAFCLSIIKELGLGTRFESVPLCLDYTSALHVAGNRTHSSRVKHVGLRYFFVQELAREGRIRIRCIKIEDLLADIGTST